MGEPGRLFLFVCFGFFVRNVPRMELVSCFYFGDGILQPFYIFFLFFF